MNGNSAAVRSFRGRNWALAYPPDVELYDHSDGEGERVTVTDLGDPRNYFGFRVVISARPLRMGEDVDAVLAAEVRAAGQGTAKRALRQSDVRDIELASARGRAATVSYDLTVDRVRYTGPDGRARATQPAVVPMDVEVWALARGGLLLTGRVALDRDREDELRARADAILAGLSWTEGVGT